MNAVFEMSGWLLALTVCLFQAGVPMINSLSTVYRHSSSGRKLFGGYRIVPKSCIASSESPDDVPKTGVCMFNYECSQKGGQMIGSCVDGFLFGACCALPESLMQSLNYLQLENEEIQPAAQSNYLLQISGSSTKPVYINNILSTSASSEPDSSSPSVPVIPTTGVFSVQETTYNPTILESYLNNQNSGGFVENQPFLANQKYPEADTILFNKDGSMVMEENDPDKLFTPSSPSYKSSNVPLTEETRQTQPTTNKPELITFSYVSDSDGKIVTATSIGTYFSTNPTTPKPGMDIVSVINKISTTFANEIQTTSIIQNNDFIPIQNGVVHVDPDLNTIEPDEDYDITTPELKDDKMDEKVHNFVEKIVNSLAGNFQDLESVLFKNENVTKLQSSNGVELINVQIGNDDNIPKRPSTTKPTNATKKPIPSSTKKPLRKTTTTTTTEIPDTSIETVKPSKRPKPTKAPSSTTKKPALGNTTPKPSKKPSTTTTISTTISPTKKPTTIRPATNKITTTTKRPTKRPIPTTTTKKPKPTTATPTTTSTTARTTSVEYDEVTETVNDITTSPTTGTDEELPQVDFKKECGVRPLMRKNGRIVGGKGANFGSYPWQVLVRESTWLGLFTKNKCGGVLITNKFVTTAAHCQPGFLASLVAVFGEFDISGELEPKRSISKNVRRVIVHRQYDPATFENDLALLELDSPVSFDEHIVPICMPRDGEDFTGRMATVTGWGRLKYGGGVPSVLQEVRVPLIENSVCQEMFQTAGHQKRIIGSFLCAGYANGQKDSCEGDSGGPLMAEREDGHWVLLGTVSHGIKCAAPYLPGVYMRTTYYKPWLKSITGVNT